MIAFLKGNVDSTSVDFAVIETHQVGYQVFMPHKSLVGLSIGAQIKIHTYLHVREDVMLLYGFVTHEELVLFKLLIGVNGVGPKAALSILSDCSIQEIIWGLQNEDPTAFLKVSGIGKKTAQRIILDVKDKVANLGVGNWEGRTQETTDVSTENGTGVIQETMDALLSLGYNMKEVRNNVHSAYKEMGEGVSVEELLSKVLKNMAGYGR